MRKALWILLATVLAAPLLLLIHAYLLVMGNVRPSLSPFLAKQSLSLLAATGDLSASHMLASMRLFQTDDPEDHKLGFATLQQEFEAGSCYAGGKLGWAYQRGLAVKRNVHHAVSLYEKAAECGMTYWQFLLAHAYEQGYLGLTPSKEKATYWLEKQPKVHVAQYECWVASYYRDGTFPHDEEKLARYTDACKE